MAGQIYGEFVAHVIFGTLEKLVDLFLRKRDRQDSILKTIVVENIGVAGRDDADESVIEDSPGSMFAAGAAAEICACQ